jgi:hypothetical protein
MSPDVHLVTARAGVAACGRRSKRVSPTAKDVTCPACREAWIFHARRAAEAVSAPSIAADEWDRDEMELGARVAYWQLSDEFGALYSTVEDRAWSVVLGCYAKVVQGRPEQAADWLPTFDAHGRWRMP